MASKTRKSIDEAKAYVNTMSAPEFYAYYQWYYDIPSSEVVKKVPVSFLMKAYGGLHDLELDLTVKKVGEI